MARRKTFFNFIILTLALALAGCGDIFTDENVTLTDGTTMDLTRRVVTIMEGERYVIPVTFTPATQSNTAVWWDIEDNAIATFQNDTLYALSPGLTRVMATSAVTMLSDTCWVEVLARPEMDWGDFPYEMMLYANVTLHGTPLTVANQEDVIIAAYVDKDLRGIGQMRQNHGIDYFQMRIGAYRPAGDTVRLRCYYRGKALAEWFPQTLTFDGEAHGTLSALLPLTIDDGAEVYEPVLDDSVEDENPYIVVPDTIVNVVTE